MKSRPTTILVVDDSALYRQTIRNVLRHVDQTQAIGVAKDGVDALEKIKRLDPDLLTLDVQMPDRDGIELLREIKRRRLRAKAIMVSSFTSRGAQVTTDALMEGAFAPGGRLYLYSDGVPEAMDENLNEFTKRQMLEIIELGHTQSLEASVSLLQGSVQRWCAKHGPKDDVSILALEITSEES